MKLVRACLDNPKEYSASLTQLLPEFSDNQALVIEFLDFAVDYFNGREQLLKKYLLLAVFFTPQSQAHPRRPQKILQKARQQALPAPAPPGLFR